MTDLPQHATIPAPEPSDEELVALARGGSAPARHDLALRYLPHSDRLVRRLAHRHYLSREDTDDACQVAAWDWLNQAVEAYDPARYSGCRFRTLHHRVVAWRFLNLMRGLRRRNGRYVYGRLPDLRCGVGDEPGWLAELAELRALRDAAVECSAARLRSLRGRAARGVSLLRRGRAGRGAWRVGAWAFTGRPTGAFSEK